MRSIVLILAVIVATPLASLAQTFTTLYSFCSKSNCSDGSTPFAGVVQGTDGNFYGTTSGGGTHLNGTVFKITPEGALTVLHSFDGTDGNQPFAGLVQGSDGNFYGTTPSGGANYAGTVFQITPEGALTVLHSFDGMDGDEPTAALVQGADGNFYGTTMTGGANNDGTVFKITPEGALTVLYSFSGTDGNQPTATLVQGSDENFYGTTLEGGTSDNCFVGGCGTVFKITPEGVLTVLHSFDSTDGSSPFAGLVQGIDGNFYGTTSAGGANLGGTVFKISSQGAITTLYSFSGEDGDSPNAALVQATDGNFYGTTTYGGVHGAGTLFESTPQGAVTTLYSFCSQNVCSDGANPFAGLVQATDGTFFGTTIGGGNDLYGGTVFRLDAGRFASLSVAKEGSGTVISGDGHIYCGGVCEYPYPKGTQVGLAAIPSAGSTFSSWTGCDNVNGDFCLMTMSECEECHRNLHRLQRRTDIAATQSLFRERRQHLNSDDQPQCSRARWRPGRCRHHRSAAGGASAIVRHRSRRTHFVQLRRAHHASRDRRLVANVTATANASQVSATLTVTPTYERLALGTGPPKRG